MIGIGVGIIPFIAKIARAVSDYDIRVVSGGGVVEASDCANTQLTSLDSRNLYNNASFIIFPSGYKADVAYAELPANGNGDLSWFRSSVANRTQSNGNISSVASNVPRLDYTYGSCPALLLESQRTNLLLQSEDLTTGSWVKSDVTATANSIVAPDGNTTADTLTATATTGVHNVQNGSHTATTTTASIYAKKGTHNFLQIYSGTSSQAFANFNLNTGVVGTFGTLATSSIQNVGNGWYRCIVTITSPSSGSTFRWALVTSASAVYAESWTATGSENLYLWGGQVEAGAYATTYISTGAATATRVGDYFRRSNIRTNGLISASGGTWYVELRGNVSLTAEFATSGFWLGTNLFTDNSNGTIYFRQGGGSQRTGIWKYEGGIGSVMYSTTTDTVKLAIKWNGTTADIFANGTKVVTATSFTATNMEFLAIASTGIGRTFFIQTMALYPTPISDADCEVLTGTSYSSYSAMATALGYTIL